MNCMENIVRYILYLFNIIFLIGGVLLIALGAIMLNDIGHLKSFDQAIQTQTIPIIVIALGAVIFVISFFGCCGTIRENVCCMSIYSIFMFILLCLQIALVAWIFVKRQDFLNAMQKVVDTAWKQNDNSHGYPMDGLQLSFDCCGLDGYIDYVNQNQPIPNSCCGKVSISNQCPQYVYEKKNGCRQEFLNFWSKNMNLIRFGGIAIAIIELIALTFACCVISGIRGHGMHN